MSIWEQVKTMADGVKNLTLWIGAGGDVVSQDDAQTRANICLMCPHNKPGAVGTREVAEATIKFLEFKNQLKLTVKGELGLQSCDGCGCVIPLMIWEPQDRIQQQMTGEELAVTPSFCWKLIKS